MDLGRLLSQGLAVLWIDSTLYSYTCQLKVDYCVILNYNGGMTVDVVEKPIRDALQFEMLQQSVTQTALAVKLNISRGHLNNIIKGKTEASFELWQKIADELGYDLLRHYELKRRDNDGQ